MTDRANLEGQIAVVTGASRGIGKAIAKELAAQGATVVINYNGSEAKADEVKHEIVEKGGCAQCMQCNVADYEGCEAFIKAVIEQFGRIDILVNNAGIIKRCDAVDVTEADWDTVIDINEKVVFFLSQAFAKQYIKQQDGGKIINVIRQIGRASMLSYQGGIRVPSYTASKSAIMGLTKALANEWAKYNINVNAIAPGYMATNNTAQLRSDDDRSDEILSRIPAGRWGTPEDMQGAVVWLASKASDYVNGYTVAVDGGWLAR